jgi:hypothetical protein
MPARRGMIVPGPARRKLDLNMYRTATALTRNCVVCDFSCISDRFLHISSLKFT